jgi:integrase
MKNHVTPVFGTTPVAMVDTPLVPKVVKPIWTTKHPTARRLRGFIESVVDWAAAHHYGQGPNPARWKGCLREALPKGDDVHIVTHHRALPHQAIGKLIAELLPRNDLDALCMLLIISTAVRLGAAVGARAEEFNLTERIWAIPPSRAKRRGKRKAIPFRVPLSDAAVTIVRRAGVKEGLLFPGVDHKSLAKIGGAETSTHGLRATAEGQTSHANEIVEMALGHAVGDETEEAYRRGDMLEKRRRLMADWAAFCSKPTTGGEVVPLRAAT